MVCARLSDANRNSPSHPLSLSLSTLTGCLAKRFTLASAYIFATSSTSTLLFSSQYAFVCYN